MKLIKTVKVENGRFKRFFLVTYVVVPFYG